jgi:hypothetical protein
MLSLSKLKILLGIILLVIVIIAGYFVYLYQQGGVVHYRPPVTQAESPKAQVLSDLKILSQAMDAYYAKNLKYPENLEELQPDFLEKIPLEPKTGKPFLYESDGKDQYRISSSHPASLGFKELFVENGKVHQN